MHTGSALPKPRRWRLLILCGVLFELFLLALCALLPEGSSLASEIHNFGFLIHSPLLWMLNTGVNSYNWQTQAFWLLSLFFVMALFWAFLLSLALLMRSWVQARIALSKRQKLIARCALGCAAAILAAMAIVQAMPRAATPFNASPDVKSAVESNTAFALDLYQKLKERPGNLFFSPYGISTALAMTWAGARNQTESDMARVLRFSLPQAKLHAAFGALSARMSKIERWNCITLTTANSIWCQRDYPFEDGFLSLVRARYDGDAHQVDFKNSAQAACGEMNDWARRKTRGRIKNVVGPGQITPAERLILCNAIYFKGKWQTQFKPDETRPTPFYVETNQTVTVPMMQQTAAFKMTQTDDYSLEMLEMPYVGNDLSMIILLPDPHSDQPTLSDLEQKLTAENLRTWLGKLDQSSSQETEVALPRFATAQSVDLADDLASMGMSSAFDSRRADFSGMDATTNLYISDVIHKAFVEVNETGTEAAAVAWARPVAKAQLSSFIADHPFIFLIRENGSGAILFLGRVVDPTK